jgi:group II intron reverse transcriptase/maturase
MGQRPRSTNFEKKVGKGARSRKFPAVFNQGSIQCAVLETLLKGNTKDANFLNERLFILLGELDLWKAAYIKLAKSQGSNTPSFDMKTIDGTTIEKLKRTRDKIMSGEYKTGITKRVYIPKTNGKTRPLGIPAFEDRLVQEVLRTILQVIYEPIFSNHSHGFRPGRGCHTALRQIRSGSPGFTWAIEGDIQSFFPNIDHNIMVKLLNKKIKDPKFVSLIHAMLKGKVMEEGKAEEINVMGSPPGGIVSPILSNIILHELDRYMENYIKEFNKGKNRRANPEYMKAYYKYGVRAARKIGQSDPMDQNFRRMHYVRYADDFVITIIGTKQEAIEIKQNVAEFLKTLNLTLSEEKTLITNPKERPISFLGYLIQKTAAKLNSYSINYAGKKRRVLRMTSGSIYLKVDSDKVRKGLAAKGYCKPNGSPIPNFKYMPNTQYATIIQMNYILRGLAGYYKLANNVRQMVIKWNYIMKFSAAMMFAAKYRTNSVAKIFAIAGKDLSRPIKKESLKSKNQIIGQTEEKIHEYLQSIGIPKRKANKMNNVGILYSKYTEIPKPDIKPLVKKSTSSYLGTVTDSSKSKDSHPLRALNWFISRTVRISEARCTICQTDQNVEMHHIRGLKYLKGTSVHNTMMKSLNRTQIPLCKTHHRMAHKDGLMKLLKQRTAIELE